MIKMFLGLLVCMLWIPYGSAYTPIVDTSKNIDKTHASTVLVPATKEQTVYVTDLKINQTRVWKLDLVEGEHFKFTLFKAFGSFDDPLLLDVVFLGPGSGNVSAFDGSNITSISLINELNSSFAEDLNTTDIYFAGTAQGNKVEFERYAPLAYIALGSIPKTKVTKTGAYYLLVSPSSQTASASTDFTFGFYSGTDLYFSTTSLMEFGPIMSQVHFDFEKQGIIDWYLGYFVAAGLMLFLCCLHCIWSKDVEWLGEKDARYERLGKSGLCLYESFEVIGRILLILAVVSFFATNIELRLSQIVIACMNIGVLNLQSFAIDLSVALGISAAEFLIFVLIPAFAISGDPYPWKSFFGHMTFFVFYLVLCVGTVFAFGAGYYAAPSLGLGYYTGTGALFGGAVLFLVGSYGLQTHKVVYSKLMDEDKDKDKDKDKEKGKGNNERDKEKEGEEENEKGSKKEKSKSKKNGSKSKEQSKSVSKKKKEPEDELENEDGPSRSKEMSLTLADEDDDDDVELNATDE